MTTASQTPGALPPEALPRSESLTTAVPPAFSDDVPFRLRSPYPEPDMPECCMCSTREGGLQSDPKGRLYPSGAQVLYCASCLPPGQLVRTTEGVIAAAMEHGAATPREIAQAEVDAGIVFDPRRARDIADAAAEQAHAEDRAEIVERGRQLAKMAGAARQRDAVLRLCEGRPGTYLLTVAEVAAAAECGTTPYDAFPMTLAWSAEDGVDVPGPGGPRRAVVRCVSSHGQRADLVVEGADRARLASLVDTEVRDVYAACPTDGCGTDHDLDAADPSLLGWARVEIAGVEDGGPRWYCAPVCVADAFARADDDLAAADRAAADRAAADLDELALTRAYGGDVDAGTVAALPAQPCPEAVVGPRRLGGAW